MSHSLPDDLIAKASASGSVDIDTINQALGECDPDEIESLYEQLEELGIEIGSAVDKDDLPSDAFVSVEELRELEGTPVEEFSATWRQLLNQAQPLSASEEKALALKVQAGSTDARLAMIRSNLRLVASVVRRYQRFGVPTADLIQEGIVGLIKAVERFDPERGRFSTYAVFWIRQAVSRAVHMQARGLRLPASAAQVLRNAAKAKRNLQQEWGREPSTEEVAQAIGVTPSQLQELMMLAADPRSLEAPVGGEDGSSLGDFIEGDVMAGETWAEKAELRLRIEELMSTLEGEKKAVLAMRFGLEDGIPRTLEEVASVLGVTKERVRQIEKQCLQQLRRVGQETDG